ncbi:MAG: hypothetical protein ACMUHU_05460 [Thermoplasmatota archaeon]
MDSNKEKVPGKLMTAGILMMIFSGLHLFLILALLFVPFIISWFIDIPIGSMSDMFVGWMNSTGGSADPGPVQIAVVTGLAYFILVLLIVYLSLMFAYGSGFVRGRLTKKPPYILAIITFATIIIPPWGGILLILKVLIGIFMVLAFKDERVKDLYDRAKDPSWESRTPPLEMALEREPVIAMVLD